MAQINTSVHNAITLAGDHPHFDEDAKALLSHKAVLAPIVKYAIPELQRYSTAFIAKNCIVGDPKLEEFAVDQGVPDANPSVGFVERLDGDAKAHMENVEDTTQNEGGTRFDILVSVRIPDQSEVITIYVNVEFQNGSSNSALETKRGIYYTVRLISREKPELVKNMDYDKLRKAYSIWLCPVSSSKGNSIEEFKYTRNVIYGTTETVESDYDLQQVVVCRFDRKTMNSENALIKYLNLLFGTGLSVEDRVRRLEDEYQMQMTKEDIGRLKSMSDYSEFFENEGIEKGQNRLGALVKMLMEKKRYADVEKAVSDPEYRNQLYVEYGIVEVSMATA